LFSNAYSGSYRTIELLLDYGADVDFVTGCGTAIDGANIGNPDNKDEIIALLRANGCKTAKELGIEIDCEYYR